MRCCTLRPVICSLFPVFAGAVALGAQSLSIRPELTRNIPLDVICAPHAATELPAPTLRVIAGLESKKGLFGTGEVVVINGGTSQGLQAGQHYLLRRVIGDRFAGRTSEAQTHSIHTAAWITIVEASTNVATARISEACDGVLEGDYLEPFTLPSLTEARAGEPDYDRPAQVILGDDRRQMGGEGSLMVVDRGSDHGVRPGQRLTIFRRAAGTDGPIVKIGEAVVATTHHESSVMRIAVSREAILVGDLVAIHR